MGISGLLITVRTGRQGAAMENGKSSQEYVEETTTLTINPEDFVAMNIAPDEWLKVTSSSSQVLTRCRVQQGPRGLFFLPLGPTANLLISGETHGTGVPDFKSTMVSLEPAGTGVN